MIEKKNSYIWFNSKISDSLTNKISVKLYDKLTLDYNKYKNINNHSYKLNDLVYCILLRYETLNSGGHQWGIPLPIKDMFKDKFNINFEMFASSLNHYYDYYCSMFYDIEKYFMSLGQFHNIKYIRGFYMANPPYEEKMLNNMFTIMNNSFTNNKNKLSFIFGTPTWDTFYFSLHDKIKSSKYYVFSHRFNDYQVKWYDFTQNKYETIPSSTRYVISNDKNIDVDGLKSIIFNWINLKINKI